MKDAEQTKIDLYDTDYSAARRRYELRSMGMGVEGDPDLDAAIVESRARLAAEALPEAPRGRKKPKTNYATEAAISNPMDRCQTPLYALGPLLPYIDPTWVIWEPAMGEGNIYRGLHRAGAAGIIGTDVLTGDNFFAHEPASPWDCLITNPPYGIKYPWLARCYQLGKPFALLIPIDTIAAGTAHDQFNQYGVEIIQPRRRINFKMPNKGYAGSAQFSTAWFTYGLGLFGEPTPPGQARTMFVDMDRADDDTWQPAPGLLGSKRKGVAR